jgi:hypothetical protein
MDEEIQGSNVSSITLISELAIWVSLWLFHKLVQFVPHYLKFLQYKSCLVFDTLPLRYMHFGPKVYRN